MNKPRFFTRLEEKARRTRFSFFANLLATIERPLVVLDIGGTMDYWRKVNYAVLGDVKFVLLNINPQMDVSPPFSSVVGDGCDLSRYLDREFNLVFSNSVIGHVGTFADQEQMAKEVRRVGKRYFVQTPNHGFFLDWRTMVPYFHFLPVSFQAWCFRHFPVGTYPRERDHEKSLHLARRIRNLRRRELKMLFPGATIAPERILGLTKSFMVYRGFELSDVE